MTAEASPAVRLPVMAIACAASLVVLAAEIAGSLVDRLRR